MIYPIPPATEPTNPHFKNFFKYLDEDGKKELLRLEAIEKMAAKALTPSCEEDVRPLNQFSNLYLRFTAIDGDTPDNIRAESLWAMHLWLMRLEVLVVE